MTNDEAKFILNAYRPNGSDAADATFGAPLAQAKNDAALGAWFNWQQSFDRAMTAKLGEVQAPAGLREAILAGAKFSQPETMQRSWWRHPALLATAASVALVATITVGLWPKSASAETELQKFVLDDTLHGERHGGHGKGVDPLQAEINQSGVRIGGGLKVDFASLATSGCRNAKPAGRDVFEVCFKRDGVWYHCYIAQRTDFPEIKAGAAPVFADQGDVSVAMWADGSHVYVVGSKTGRASLQKLI